MRRLLCCLLALCGAAVVSAPLQAGQVPISKDRTYSPQDVEVIRRAEAIIFDTCAGLAEAADQMESPTLNLVRLGQDAWGDMSLRQQGWYGRVALGFWNGLDAEYIAIGRGETVTIEAKGALAQAACALPASPSPQRSTPLDAALTF